MDTLAMMDATACPLCGQANDCQLCTVAAYKGACWCAQVEIPAALLAQVPPELRNKNCICRACVTAFQRIKKADSPAPKALPGDFYFDGGLMVFTAAVNGDIGSPGTIINLPQFTGTSYHSGSGFNLSFVTQPNLNYSVQFKENLTDANWQILTNFTATASSFTLTDPTASTNSARFYRVVVTP